MDLRKRLASLDKLSRKPEPITHPVSGTSDEPADFDPLVLATEDLGFQERQTPLGPCFFRDYQDVVPPFSLPANLTGFYPRPIERQLLPEEIMFLDTETTGLAGGTGTMAFLVGLSWMEKGNLHTRQYFLCSPAGEAAMLDQIRHKVAEHQAVATFNGASFDLPLLKTRGLLNRMHIPWDNMISLDLLVPSRRLWRRQLENCRQQSVEKGVCGLRRESQDIDGQLIPQTWFDFLKMGKTADLHRVLYHNHQDMVGMAHILSLISERVRDIQNPEQKSNLAWQEKWSLGRIAEQAGNTGLSIGWMERAWEGARQDLPAATEPRLVMDTLRVLKRSGNWTLVQDVIDQALAEGLNEWWLHREAAILYEHRLVDLNKARKHALEAGDEHRLQRVLNKLKNS